VRRWVAVVALVVTMVWTPLGSSAAPIWSVGVTSGHRVVSRYAIVVEGGVQFRALELMAGNAVLRWHVGSQDPPTNVTLPADVADRVDWPSEGRPGVVALFNGGFKVAAKAGGSMADGVVLSPLIAGDATIALNARGAWEMGVWGSPSFPRATFHPIAIRQNLTPLVRAGQPTATALSPSWGLWGDTLKASPTVARSALGVTTSGNLIYLATMKPVLPSLLAQALVKAGAWFGMELDINPYWPVLGGSFSPLHGVGPLPVQIPYSEHNPSVYFSGWERDFFVAVAEPASPNCSWAAPGLPGTALTTATPVPQPLSRSCTP